jgi:hypothetical protein
LAALSAWALAHVVGGRLERGHRREFLAALGVAPRPDALASDSALDLAVRTEIFSRVPVGSDTLAVWAYVRRIGAANRLDRVNDEMHSGGKRVPDYLWLSFPERVRWYEVGACEWSRVLEFRLDSAAIVRGISAKRVGACI